LLCRKLAYGLMKNIQWSGSGWNDSGEVHG
jgi:hypothetical protein